MRLPPRWIVVVSVAVAAAILGDSLLYAVLPTQWSRLGLDLGMVGILLSANRFVRLAANPVAGWILARAGVRGPLLVALFASALTTAAYASGLGFAVLLLARILWGVCWSFLRLSGFLAAFETQDGESRGYYIGFFNGATRFGSFAAVLAGGVLTDQYGFRFTVLLFAVVSLAGGLLVLREPSHGPTALRARPPTHTEEPLPPLVGAPDATRALRRWLIYASVFLHTFAVSGLVTATLGLWLLDLYGPHIRLPWLTVGVATLTGLLLGARFLTNAIGGPAAGHFSDRYGRTKITLLALSIEVLTLVGLSTARQLLGTTVTALGLFMAATALQVALDATAGDLAPPGRRARSLGWYTTWLDLGAATGPLAGYFAGPILGLAWIYRATAAALGAAGVCYIILFRSPPALHSRQ